MALWSSTNDDGDPLDDDFDESDIEETAKETAKKECADFIEYSKVLLALSNYKNPLYCNASLAGHDFWLTRNGHGAGFWDRDLGELGDKLTESCESLAVLTYTKVMTVYSTFHNY